MTGIDDPYEPPLAADLVIDTAQVDLDTAVRTAEDHVAALLNLEHNERTGTR
jgi:adenylylsulfate kinase-like enzyme